MMLHTLTMFAAVEDEGVAALGIDPLAIMAQAVTFLVLFFIIKKFALESIVNMLQERHKKIDDGVRLGLKMEAEYAKLQERVEEQLHQARNNADTILSDAQKEAGSIMKEAQDRAAAKVDTMIAEAHLKIEDDMKKARRELEKDLRFLVADAVQIVAEEKIDAGKDAKLIDKALLEARQ